MLDLILKILAAILKPFAGKVIDEATRPTIAQESKPVDSGLVESLRERVRQSENRTGSARGSD